MKKRIENFLFLALLTLLFSTYLYSGSPLEKGSGTDMTKTKVNENKVESLSEVSSHKGEVTHHGHHKNMTSKPNRLAKASSPYLIQHAFNPVDWYEWGDVAFDKAKKEDKLVFLSIGYSACHWCHVMAHESFEDEDVARALNEVFISIKVDREERPDIDGIYMDVCQMMTGSGGWPLTIILTPDRKPVFAGTYIPKESRYGRPGILDITAQLANIWKTDRKKIVDSAASITSALKRMSESGPSGGAPSQDYLNSAYSYFAGAFDSTYGGFGVSRKFPTPHNLYFLLRYWDRHKSGSNSPSGKKALQMVEQTLWSMRSRGLWDHVGYGFHRYSTDKKWLLPHFEKMLYDQALLSIAYVEGWQATGKDEYEETARKTFEYVLRDLRDAGGGFHSAEDADSEGEEGKFYVWSATELADVLTKEEAAITASVFNVAVKGNFKDEATGRPSLENILHRTASIEDLAVKLEMTSEKLSEIIESLRVKLFNVRKERVRPGLDDKVLVDWNGLMIAALANGGRVFNDDSYTKAAREAADFIISKMKDSSGRLHHRYRNGKSGLTASVDDYAFFTWGLIELYETTFEAAYLNETINLTETLLTHYWDKGSGSFFFSPDDGEKLLIRRKDCYDGATPSGNSVAAMNLLRLARITGRSDFEARAAAIPRTFARSLQKMAGTHTHLLCALDFAFGPSSEIVIAKGNDTAGAKAMLDLIESRFNPNKVVLLQSEDLLEVASYTKDYVSVDGKATAYVCSDFKCSLPVTKLEELAEMLAKK